MSTPLNILMIEDSEDDALLILRELRRGGFSIQHRRVDTAKAMQAAIREVTWDLIISDYNLPGFSGLAALKLFKQSGLDIPFFLVSGAVGEDIAVEAMKSGAQDYIKKDNLARLIPAIQRELREVEVRQDRDLAKERLLDTENRYQTLVENIPIGLFRSALSLDAQITLANPALALMLGFSTVDELNQQKLNSIFEAQEDCLRFLSNLRGNNAVFADEVQLKKKDGSLIWVAFTARVGRESSGHAYFDCTIEDISSRKQSDKLKDALYRISQAANAAKNFYALVHAVHQIIGDLMPAQNFYMALYDPATQYISFPYFVDQYDSAPDPMPINKGLTAYVIRSGLPLLARPAFTNDLISRNLIESSGSPSVDWLGVPLKTVMGEVIGALVVQTYDEGLRYTDQERDVLTFVSDQLGAVIERQRANDALSASDARQRALLEAIPDLIFVLDTEGVVVDCKIPLGGRFPLNIEEIIHKRTFELLPPEIDLSIMAAVRWVLAKGKMQTIQIEWNDLRNQVLNYEVRLTLGGPGQVMALVRDVTETFQAEQRIEQQRLFLRQVIDINPNLIFAKDSKGRFTLANQALAHFYGTTVENLLGKTDDDFHRMPSEIAFNRENDRRVIETLQESVISEELLTTIEGHERWLQTVRRPLILSDQNEVQVLGVSTDITERKMADERMLHNAFHDSLTSLPNRAMVMKNLETMIEQIKNGANNKQSALLMLDLDQFAVVNDSLGYQVGDALLMAIAAKLIGLVGTTSLVARTGGDEFIILVSEIDSETQAVELAEMVISELHQPILLYSHRIISTISVGLVIGLKSYDKPENVLRDADIALHRAKTQGRGRYTIFDDVMRSTVVARLELENDLRHAIEADQLEIYFEPIISLRTGQACMFEALLRWNHPTRGLVMPGSFVHFAEETGLILPMGKWIIYEVCRLIRRWEILYPWTADVVISVNISGKQFAQPEIVDIIRDALSQAGIRADRLRLEITESVLMERPDLAVNALNQLRDMGARIFIDDFGTGYSSLYYLHNLPLNAIKIDRSFISGKDRVKGGNEIVHTIVRLANELQLETVAEGVETIEQLRWMKDLNLDYVQGFLFFSSLGTCDFENFLKEHKTDVDWIQHQLMGN